MLNPVNKVGSFYTGRQIQNTPRQKRLIPDRNQPAKYYIKRSIVFTAPYSQPFCYGADSRY